MRRAPPLARLARDRRAVAVVEFAIVAPVMCMFLVLAFDVAHTLYLTATLQGIVQKTARDSTLEANSSVAQAAIVDNRVRAQVTALVNNIQTLDFKRRFYRTFALAQSATAETWRDTDRDGTCDHNEGYDDNNGNGVWDADGGDGGQGGAKDKTVYTVTVTYRHLVPVWKYLGGSDMQTLVAKTVLQNQPYGDQGNYSTTIVQRYCA